MSDEFWTWARKTYTGGMRGFQPQDTAFAAWHARDEQHAAAIAAKDAEIAELVSIPDELAERFHCLAHAHKHRWHEALCSAMFQLSIALNNDATRSAMAKGCEE